MIRGSFLNGAVDNLDECFAIRSAVFVNEQQVPESEEFDEYDAKSGHYIIYNEEGIPVATGRLIRDDELHFRIGRVATLKAYRNKGYAEFLMLSLIEKVRSLGGTEISLLAQLPAVGFYEKCGFTIISDAIVMDAGIEHYEMKYIVDANHTCECCKVKEPEQGRF